MFEMSYPNIIQRLEGFSVEMISRTKLVYTESGRSVKVDCEWLAGPHSLVVYTDTLTHWTVPDGIEISSEERAKIVDNIRKAFRFRGVEIEVQ